MKSFQVILTQNAKSNLQHYYLRAAEHAPDTARNWFNRFEEALHTLSVRPERCRLAPENDVVPEEIREFLFGKRVGTYRVLFTMTESTVLILHIRRAAMDVADEQELRGE
ncbi:MAG: type II toxin-antitoxin system RelE/ParE family toxin [Planctomycetaceae bacterium]|nr:type II toxin-antitoxin system RelE/ParE family toxin [Planctomycetaceae bacterium]